MSTCCSRGRARSPAAAVLGSPACRRHHGLACGIRLHNRLCRDVLAVLPALDITGQVPDSDCAGDVLMAGLVGSWLRSAE